LKRLTAMILNWGWKVVVLYPEPNVIAAWVDKTLPEHRSRFFAQTYVLNRRLKVTRWNLIRDAIHSAERQTGWHTDLVLFTFLTSIISGPYWFAKRFIPRPWAGLYYDPTPHRRNAPMSSVRRKCLVFRDRCLLRSTLCRGIGVQDEETVDSLRAIAGNRVVVYIPQVTDLKMPATDPPDLRAIRAKAQGRKVIGLIGLLEKRKGLINFVRMIEHADPNKAFFVLAGQFKPSSFSEAERKELHEFFAKGTGGHWHVQLGYLEDEETVNGYIALCDSVFLAYENHFHSSGVLAKAALMRKLVIASRGGYMAEIVQRYRLGVTVAPGSFAELSTAIDLLSDHAKYVALQEKAAYDQYREAHSMHAFETAVRQLLSR
jgi:glycosyltransferase involved in cell wall biosynthesis